MNVAESEGLRKSGVWDESKEAYRNQTTQDPEAVDHAKGFCFCSFLRNNRKPSEEFNQGWFSQHRKPLRKAERQKGWVWMQCNC